MAMNAVNDLVVVLGNGLPPVAPRWTVLVDYKLLNLTERHITTGSEAVTYKRRDIHEIRIVCDLLQDLRTVGPGSTILPTSRLTAWEFTNQLIQKKIKFAI